MSTRALVLCGVMLAPALAAAQRCETFNGRRVCCAANLCPTTHGCASCGTDDFIQCHGSNDPKCSGINDVGPDQYCPAKFPVSCGNGRCCDNAHPNCCSGGCCDAQHPRCCGNGRCCDSAHPYCCPDGTCGSTQSACNGRGNGCSIGYVPALAATATKVCCPRRAPYLCNDGSCDVSRNCHGVGLKGTAKPTGSGGGGPFMCTDTLQCSSLQQCSRCGFKSCACATGTCVRGWYQTSDGRTFACDPCTTSCSSAAQALISSCCQ